MSPSAFIVSRFVNRNGITSWRVDGRLHGLRIRKNFKYRVEVGAEKACASHFLEGAKFTT